MALRNLATRMTNPAAAALRLPVPAPRVSTPAAGAHPTRFYYTGQVSRWAEDTYTARKAVKENLALLEEVKKHEQYMRSRIWWIQKSSKCLCWTFKLLSPVPLVVAVVKAAG